MDDRTRRIIESATYAPSGDNSQPWSFVVHGDTIEVYMHPERDHALLNVRSGGTLIGAGAALENMTIAARVEGLDPRLAICPDASNPSLVARVKLDPGVASLESERALAACIRTRHTNRTPYSADVLPDEFRTTIGALADAFPPCRIVTIDSRDALALSGKAASAMEEVALQTKPLHALFFNSIIWSKERNEAGEPGMYIMTMELPPPVRALFRMLRHWPIVSLLNRVGFAKQAAAGNATVYASSSAMIAFIVPDRAPASMLAAGRAMQRIWLEATRLGLAGQPLAGLLYIAASIEEGNAHLFSEAALARIRVAQADMRKIAGAGEGEAVAIFMRFGKPERPPTDYSRRMPPMIRES